MRILITALTLAFCASVAGADIGWKADRIAPGSVFVMRDAVGDVTHVKRVSTQTAHHFDTYAGQGRDAEFLGSYAVDADGNVTETMTRDGAVTRFVPHRCNRTLGRCAFTVHHADGFAETRSRVTVATADGLRYREYGLDGLIAEGALVLDALGTAKNGWKKHKTDTRKTRSKRILIALR